MICMQRILIKKEWKRLVLIIIDGYQKRSWHKTNIEEEIYFIMYFYVVRILYQTIIRQEETVKFMACVK